jgi:hypothetical protein
MRVRAAQNPRFARRANRNGEEIRENCAAVFRPAYFADPTGFKGYFCKTGPEVRVFGSSFWFVEDRTDSSVELQR